MRAKRRKTVALLLRFRDLEQHELIKRAAGVDQRPLSQYILRAAYKAAMQDLQRPLEFPNSTQGATDGEL
jgi:uncharacterized protein (DUF1778 family)